MYYIRILSINIYPNGKYKYFLKNIYQRCENKLFRIHVNNVTFNDAQEKDVTSFKLAALMQDGKIISQTRVYFEEKKASYEILSIIRYGVSNYEELKKYRNGSRRRVSKYV